MTWYVDKKELYWFRICETEAKYNSINHHQKPAMRVGGGGEGVGLG